MKLSHLFIISVFGIKCPRCREGSMFENKNPYQLKSVSKMNSHCKVCGQALEPEPSFYYGAMYVSYALTVGFSLVFFALLYFVFDVEPTMFLVFNAFTLFLLWPYIFRLSRSLWIAFFIKYNPNAKHEFIKQ